MNKQFYDIYLNEAKLATIGPNTFGLFITFSANREENKVFLRADAACSESGENGSIEWLDEEIKHSDSIKISLSQCNKASKPLHTRKYIKNAIACSFCAGTENNVGSLIKLENSPHICLDCVNVCIELLKPDEPYKKKTPYYIIEKELFYDVYINETKAATIGPHTNGLYVTFSAFEDKSYLSASSSFLEMPGLVKITEWFHKEIKDINYSNLIQISPSQKSEASIPFRTKKHKTSTEDTKNGEITRKDNICDFCKSITDDESFLIKVNYAPQICRNCVDLCAKTFKSMK